MAGRNGNFLSQAQREFILKELEKRESSMDCDNFGTGCLACGEDDDHANLLLCEGCNAEYHTYCLSPPLRSVPTGDWFCAKCKLPLFEDDGLDKLVNALPPAFTSRFGEICWAQGGVGFGWWPAFIYDPRLTVGSARQLARKNLGKRHLVYFFECHDAPFACLLDSKMTKWEDGLLEDYHMGKTAKASGRARIRLFQQALQAATVEMGKPVELRMEFNHTDQPQILPSPKFRKPKRRLMTEEERVAQNGTMHRTPNGSKRRPIRGFPLLSDMAAVDPKQNQIPTRRNLHRAMEALAVASATNEAESMEDGELCCKLLKRLSTIESLNVGFVKLPSRLMNTFEDARKVIEQEIDCLPMDKEWRFYIPKLGPMSRKQESTLGPMYKFLRLTTYDSNLGEGTLMNPLQLVIQDVEPSA